MISVSHNWDVSPQSISRNLVLAEIFAILMGPIPLTNYTYLF